MSSRPTSSDLDDPGDDLEASGPPNRATAAPNRACLASERPRINWGELLALFLGSRLVIVVIAGLSLQIVGKGSTFTPSASPLDWFMRWDAVWFRDIAADGYYFTGDGAETNVVFLPLYPGLIRLVSLGGLIPLRIAGYAVSLACLWIACVWLWRAVAREWQDPRLATLTVAFLLFGPVSFFFSTLYSEALFLMLAVGCVTFTRERRWWLAGLLGAAAASTRFVGVLLIVPLLWEAIATHVRDRGTLRGLRFTPLIACALPALGLAAYCSLMWVEFGDPLMYFRGQLHWGRKFAWWWDLLARDSFSGQPLFYQLWFAATVVISLALIALGALFRMPSVYLVFALTLSFIYLSSRFVEGLPRYFSVVFPLYIAVALACRRWPKTTTPLLALSASLQSLSVILFVNGYWFT